MNIYKIVVHSILLIFILTQTVDFYSTKYIMESGKGKEMNLLVDVLMSKVGITPGLLIAKGGAVAAAITMVLLIPDPCTMALLTMCTVFYVVLLCKYNYPNYMKIKEINSNRGLK